MCSLLHGERIHHVVLVLVIPRHKPLGYPHAAAKPWKNIKIRILICISSATRGDGPQHVELLVAKPGAVLFPEAVAPGPKDVSHLYGRPHHLTFFPMKAAACLANAREL